MRIFDEDVARQMTDEENADAKATITLDMNEALECNTNDHYNLGYSAILKLYHSLGLQRFFNNAQRHREFSYNISAVVTLLVISRILSPGSKKKAYEEKNRYFERFDFELVDVYRSLSFLSTISREVQAQINTAISALNPRDTSIVYYDVTNFYFEIDEEDNLRKRGFSKEKRRDPIVQMGLAMDRDGIPLHYDLFEGNKPDTMTFRSVIGEVRRSYNTGRIIVIADRGITSGDNIFYLVGGEKKSKANNGYIFSYSIAGSNDEFRSFVLDPGGYYDPSGAPVTDETTFKIKSRLHSRDIWVTMRDGSRKKRTVYEKQVVFWSRKHALKMSVEREKQIDKAQAMISSPAKLKRATSYGAARYVQNICYDEDTGEVIETGKHVALDEVKIEQEAKFDGYYAIVTSEHAMPDAEIVEHYRGLWEIEETFRITKSLLEARPVYVSREERIKAHFLTCYIALVIMRLLQRATGSVYSCEKLIEAMNGISAIREQDNIYLFGYRTDVTDAIGTAVDIDFTRKRMKLHEIKTMLAACKK
jgi:transposase